MNKNVPILVIGAGSIGERHIRNLWQLGYKNISVFRQRNLPFRDISNAEVNVITDWKEIEKQNFFAAFICTPTSQHMQQSISCLQENMHVFMEKPLSHNTDGFHQLQYTVAASQKYFFMGYMLHYHPFLQQVKNYILENTFGTLNSFETTWHSYLPHWHPWEDYRKSYAANRDAGGGAALTLCHDVELMLWMCAGLKHYKTKFSYCEELQVEVDTGAKIDLQFEKSRGTCNISFCSAQEKRMYHFSFDHADIEINYLQNEMKITVGKKDEIHTLPAFERNDMYVCEVEDFFSIIHQQNYNTAQITEMLAKEKQLISICNPQSAAAEYKNSKT